MKDFVSVVILVIAIISFCSTLFLFWEYRAQNKRNRKARADLAKASKIITKDPEKMEAFAKSLKD